MITLIYQTHNPYIGLLTQYQRTPKAVFIEDIIKKDEIDKNLS